MRTPHPVNDATASARPPERRTRPPAPCGASCDVLRVSYTTGLEETPLALSPDRIHILVPEGEAVLQAAYTPADGRPRRTVVRAPAVCVVPAHEPHRVWSESPCNVLSISLGADFHAQRARSEFGTERPVIGNYSAEDPFLRGLASALAGTFRAGHDPSPRYLDSLASTVALHLATNYHAQAAPPAAAAGLAAHKLQRVLATIEHRLTESVQVKELAESIHMSAFHFARMFKLATGFPPHAYITQQRMERAKALLGFTDLPLAEVATQVGYQTQAHFTGVFHRYVGLTPRVFRRGCRARAEAAAQDRGSDPAPARSGVLEDQAREVR